MAVLASTALVCGSRGVTADTATPNVAVTSDKPYSYQQPSLAVNPKNPQRMAIAYREGAQRSVCELALSSDGGATWHTQDLIGPQGRLPWDSANTLCYESAAVYGPDGTLYYAVQAAISFRDPFSRVLVTSSPDGVAFSDPVDVDPGTRSRNSGDLGGGDWYPRLAVNPTSGELFVRWTHYASRNASAASVVASSTDHGLHFSAPVVATPAPDSGNTTSLIDSYGTAIAVGADGTVYTSWLDLTRRNAGCSNARPAATSTCSLPVPLEVAASRDGGRSFGAPVTVASGIDFGCPGRNVAGTTALASCDNLHFDRGPEAFSLLAGSTSGMAALAWWGGDPENPARMSVATTHNAGGTWSSPKQVGTIKNAANDEQNRPVLAQAPGGRIDMAYYDTSNGGSQDVYLATSDDGGATFSTPQLVTTTSSNINVGPVSEDGVHPGFGEWLGLVSTDSGAQIAWTDTRRGTVDSAKQDIYFASVQLVSGTPVWVPIAAAVGGVLVLAGLTLVVLGIRSRRRAPETEAARPAAGRV
ncbi:MAG: exo-alpha-sialidase [Candidatus Dormibacteraeota bacterium]|nr:exo-alpha-sialidase [Candidatus Dormibacteraeota bacterium]